MTTDTPTYQHLAWAGVELRWGSHRVLIDPLEDVARLAGMLGAPRAEVRSSERGDATRTDVLLTHAHADHFDPAAIARALHGGGAVWCMPEIAAEVEAHAVPVHAVELYEEQRIGPFSARPVPAQDWHADPQVSWVVGSREGRLIHGGDTMWHGHWWRIAELAGPIDIACLPINGFIAHWPGLESADVPGSLTPHQAVEAAHVLGAHTLCPMHFGLFDNPPLYQQTARALESLLELAERRGIAVAQRGAIARASMNCSAVAV